MSVGMIMTAVKVVSTVMAAKSAIEGIKEGNLLKAVVGGAGAYFGASSLMSGAGAGTAAGASDVATGGATAAASGAEGVSALSGVAEGVAAAANPTVMNAATAGASVADGVVSGGLMDKIGGFASDLGLESAGDWLAASNDAGGAFGSGGLLDFSGGEAGGLTGKDGLFSSDYAKGQLISGGMQIYGGKMAGDGMQEKAEWELAQKERMYEEARKRRASTGSMDFLKTSTWNPQTGRFEPTQQVTA